MFYFDIAYLTTTMTTTTTTAANISTTATGGACCKNLFNGWFVKLKDAHRIRAFHHSYVTVTILNVETTNTKPLADNKHFENVSLNGTLR